MFADLLDATLRRNDKWHSHRTHKNKRWKGQEVPILGVMRHGWVKKRFEGELLAGDTVVVTTEDMYHHLASGCGVDRIALSIGADTLHPGGVCEESSTATRASQGRGQGQGRVAEAG